MEEEIKGWIRAVLSKTTDAKEIFPLICDKFKAYASVAVTTGSTVKGFIDIKSQSTTVRGNYFEVFCCMYLHTMFPTADVWLLRDCPQDVRILLNLKDNDVGLDIILRVNTIPQMYWAIQAKYRVRKEAIPLAVVPGVHTAASRNTAETKTTVNPKMKQIKSRIGPRKIGLTWKQLSTFIALTAATGPTTLISGLHHNISDSGDVRSRSWACKLVMTTADYVRHETRGRDTQRSFTVMAYARFCATPRDFWIKMSGMGPGHTLSEAKDDVVLKIGIADKPMREKRSAWLDKIERKS